MARGTFGAVPRRRTPIWICIEEFEFLDLVDFGDTEFSVETVIWCHVSKKEKKVGTQIRSSPRTIFCLITTCEQAHYISPTSWLLLPWQASPPGTVKSQRRRGQSCDIKTGHTSASEIPMPLLVSSVVTHHYHHRPVLPFQDWHPFTKPSLILTEEISSTFVPRGFVVVYPILRSGT